MPLQNLALTAGTGVAHRVTTLTGTPASVRDVTSPTANKDNSSTRTSAGANARPGIAPVVKASTHSPVNVNVLTESPVNPGLSSTRIPADVSVALTASLVRSHSFLIIVPAGSLYSRRSCFCNDYRS